MRLSRSRRESDADMLLKALTFDVDGTLAETEELHRICCNDAFANAGHGWEWRRDRYCQLLKVTGGKERIRHYLDRISLDLGTDAAARIAELHAEKNRLYAHRTALGVALRPAVRRLIGVKFVVKRVKADERKPHGLNYNLTLHDESGERIVGFDNAHPVPTPGGPAGKKRVVNDHRHRFKTIRPYDYKDAATLLEDF